MTAITFDTLKFSKRLQDAGVPARQAEAEAEALSEVLEVNLKELATKEDMLAAQKDIRQEMELLRRDMDARFIQLEQRLIIRLGMLIAASIGIVAALVKLL